MKLLDIISLCDMQFLLLAWQEADPVSFIYRSTLCVFRTRLYKGINCDLSHYLNVLNRNK